MLLRTDLNMLCAFIHVRLHQLGQKKKKKPLHKKRNGLAIVLLLPFFVAVLLAIAQAKLHTLILDGIQTSNDQIVWQLDRNKRWISAQCCHFIIHLISEWTTYFQLASNIHDGVNNVDNLTLHFVTIGADCRATRPNGMAYCAEQCATYWKLDTFSAFRFWLFCNELVGNVCRAHDL